MKVRASERKEICVKLRITIAGNIYEADVEVLEDEEVSASPVEYAPPAYLPSTGYLANSTAVVSENRDPSDKTCRSPVTGLVIRVDVPPGQAVEAGQLLVVLEAMKMETQVTAPRAGTVQIVHVAPGNSVKVNQPLIELEWEEPLAGDTRK
jgi:biotin carboxyl carrier protein